MAPPNARSDHGSSLNVPLIHDDKQPKLEDVEAVHGHYVGSGDTSFFNTCFNGLNALSGN
ncbi:hypothetical protein SLEP1_g20325 [Rubroshorea leprosula]|uniref:Uncharacterized protein n=1 Tax=Rubroshorea leprosula TaxID=152421 RepID=A0AAV5JBH6_9ROSI|nr:hypothetical protein SLEP1_g20325 [Rubroshorea leprosula]